MKIGFIGTGIMGEPMARNLLRAGHDLIVYNRTGAKTESLRQDGARVAGSPAEAAAEADVLVTMLANDEAARATILGGDPAQRPAIETLRPSAIHMSAGTISVRMSRELEAAHHGRGQQYVVSTVLGRAEAAGKRQLWVIAAGPQDQIERCRPLFEALGRGVSVVGAEPWKANLVKIGANFVLATMLEAFGEAFALVEKHGIERRGFLEVLNEGAVRSPVFEQYGSRIIDRRYDPAGFFLDLGFKDVQLAIEAAVEARVPLPFGGVISDRFLQRLAHGEGRLDWSAIAEGARQDAGIVTALKAGG